MSKSANVSEKKEKMATVQTVPVMIDVTEFDDIQAAVVEGRGHPLSGLLGIIATELRLLRAASEVSAECAQIMAGEEEEDDDDDDEDDDDDDDDDDKE